MTGDEGFQLAQLDYVAFGAYFVILSLIGYFAGRKEKLDSDAYFLAGRSLPWYVVGGSFIASNISSEHFIGMIGGAFVFGICVSLYEWANVTTFSLLIWFFIPFLLMAKVFTIPEFLERRFHPALRQIFAVVTILSNVLAFLAAVLYGGGLALHKMFGWNLWLAIILLGVVAGCWAIYGGLRSVAWTDFFTVIVMLCGGVMITILGLEMLSGDSHSLWDGFKVMIERNRGRDGIWAEVVAQNAQNIVHQDSYNRLSVIQPVTHELTPWPFLIFATFTISLWYNVLNQFMIQRVLGAKNIYHARMGIVFAGYMKIILPVIVVLPGLILFARFPEVMKLPWEDIQQEADKGYVTMLKMLVPIGLRGLFLAALFGAIQSTINSVLNSTATIFTLDIYKRLLNPDCSEARLVRVGMWSSASVLAFAIVLAGFVGKFGGLFTYVQSMYAFFAPPFAAVFALGILFRRINAAGAISGVVGGFIIAVSLKLYVLLPGHWLWLEPFMNQAILNWVLCLLLCTTVSMLTSPPRPEQVTDKLTMNWNQMNILEDLGTNWFNHVVVWWGLFVILVAGLLILFSGLFL